MVLEKSIIFKKISITTCVYDNRVDFKINNNNHITIIRDTIKFSLITNDKEDFLDNDEYQYDNYMNELYVKLNEKYQYEWMSTTFVLIRDVFCRNEDELTFEDYCKTIEKIINDEKLLEFVIFVSQYLPDRHD